MTAEPHDMDHLTGTGRTPADAPPLAPRVIRGPWSDPEPAAPSADTTGEEHTTGAALVPHISDAEIVEDDPTPGKALVPTRVHRRVVVPAGVTRAGQALRRPDRIAGAVLRHELVYGSIGTARGAGALWRWMTADELSSHLATNPQLVLDTRRKRRNVALGGAGTVAAGTGALWLLVSPWAVLGMVALVLAVAGAVERRRTTTVAVETGRSGLGTAPSGREVRKALTAAGIGKRADELRLVGPVARDEGRAWVCTVELPQGWTYRRAAKKLDAVAASVGVDESQVAMDPVRGHAGRVRLWVADEDPMQGDRVVNPLAAGGAVDFWRDKATVGADRRGRPVAFSMIERSYLIGGEPGGGKSVASNNVLSFFALDPRVQIHLADGKFGFDLAIWRPVASSFLEDQEPAAFLDWIDMLRDEMERRYALLKKVGQVKITEALAEKHDMHPWVVHIDEIQYWTASGDKKRDTKAAAAVADLVGRGRAAGIITGVVTQRPAAEVVPTRLRDILSIRWALRCTTATASDTILGQGWASQGASAASIRSDQRGAGYILAEGDAPVLLRSAFLDETGRGEVSAIVRRAVELRRAAGTLGAPDDDPRVLLLRAMHTAMRDERGDHTEHLLSSLREADPDRWGDLTSDALAATLRPLEVTPGQVKITDPETGKKVNRNGYRREHVTRALEALRAL